MSFLFRRAAEPVSPAPPAHFGSQSPAPSGATSLDLVRYNTDTGKFELGEQALQVLKNTRGPIGVVAVAGRARQGKSFILNQLLGRSGSFKVDSTHRPCTKGIRMWSAPVSHTGPDGSKYNLILLDTEGIDAYDQTAQYSTQIFSLAVLLSSLFIYNQIGPIDEAALDRLSLVTEMTKHIRVRASSGAAEDASELAAFTPAFIWLLRDFYLRLEEDGRKVSPRDYLETALQQLPGAGAAVHAKNQVREGIKSLFPNRDCFTLVRPVNSEDELARLDSLPPSALRPEFRDALSKFTKLVLSKAQPKRLGSQMLTGPLLAGLAEAYVTAINAGAVPTITTAWQGVAESECRRAGDAAEAAYMTNIQNDTSSVLADEASLEAANQKALAEAQRVFDEIAIGDVSVKQANDARWKTACAARFKELKERKMATAALACERAINDATARLHALVRREGTTLEDLRKEAASFEAAYERSTEASGPTKWPRFAQFMRESYAGAVKDLTDKQEQARAAATAAANQRALTAENNLKSLTNEVQSLRVTVGQAEVALATERQKVAALEAQIAQLRQEMRNERTRLLSEAEQRSRSATGPLEQRLAGANSELDHLRRQTAALAGETRSMSDRLVTVAAERDQIQQQLAQKQTALVEAEQRIAQLQTEVNALKNSSQVVQQHQPHRQPTRAMQEASWNIPGGGVTTRGTAQDATIGDGVADGDGGVEMLTSPVSPGPMTEMPPPPPQAVVGLDTSKMKINDLKQWLMSNGHEAMAWELANKRGVKKADWEAAVKQAAGL